MKIIREVCSVCRKWVEIKSSDMTLWYDYGDNQAVWILVFPCSACKAPNMRLVDSLDEIPDLLLHGVIGMSCSTSSACLSASLRIHTADARPDA